MQRSLPLLPANISLASLTHVLDVGCGQHLWGRALFRAMLEQAGPDLITDVRIDGIESCHELVHKARTSLRTGRAQVCISQGNLLALPSASQNRYQLVQMRFLALSLAPLLGHKRSLSYIMCVRQGHRHLARTIIAYPIR